MLGDLSKMIKMIKRWSRKTATDFPCKVKWNAEREIVYVYVCMCGTDYWSDL